MISPSFHHRISRVVATGLCCVAFPLASQAADPKASRYYEDALTRYEKKDISGAIIQLKNALQIDKTMLPVQVLLGQALLADGQVGAAEVALLEALRLGVNRAELAVPLARAYVAQGKQKMVLDQPLLSPDGLPAEVRLQLLLVRATAMADLGDVRGALQSIAMTRDIDSRRVEVWLAEVPIRIRTREFAAANEAADKALALVPNSADALYQKASIAHVTGDLRAALSGYERVLAIDASHLEARVARAGLLLDLQRPDDAAKDVAELRRLSPREPRGAYLHALLAERAGNAAEAKTSLQAVTALLDPVPVEFIRFRPQLLMLNGLAHYGLNEKEKAKPYLETLQRVQGQNTAAKLLAQIYLSEGNVDRAVEVLDLYLKSQPGDSQAMMLLASAYMAGGRTVQAASLMQEALRTSDTPANRTALGMSLIGSGRAEEGAVELERAFKRDASQTQAGSALVGVYLRAGQTAKALSTAEQLAKQAPKNAMVLNLLGVARVRSGDPGGARAAFEQAVKLDDRLQLAKLNLARLDMTADKFELAATRLGELLKVNDRDIDVLGEMATLSLRRDQPDEARRWLERANEFSGPREVRPGISLVDFYLRRGENAPALEAAKRLTSKGPEDLDVLMAYARAQMSNADQQGARSSLTAATRVAGFDAPKQVEIALMQISAGNVQGAAYSIEKALSSNPGFLPALALRVDVEIRQGDLAKADQHARQIVQGQPKRAIGYSLLGDVAMANRQGAAAVDAYRRAHQAEPSSETVLRLMQAVAIQDGDKAVASLGESWLKAHPQDLLVRKALANAQARNGNFAAARVQYDLILKSAPQDVEALNNMANVLLRVKDPGALAYAEKALARDPSNPTVIDTAGWAAYQARQPERALQLLRDARLRDPANPAIRYHLAVLLSQSERRAEAREELENALRSGRKFDGVVEAEALVQTLR